MDAVTQQNYQFGSRGELDTASVGCTLKITTF